MATLSYIKIIKDKHLLRLGITEGEECAAYTVSETLYREVGSPTRGAELDSETFECIRRADSYYRAKRKALSLLGYADNTEYAMIGKLRRAGYSREVAEEVCREMVSLGYINEEASCERLILIAANDNLYGPDKIFGRLVQKGYSTALVRRILARLCESGEIDFAANARKLTLRKLGEEASADARRALLYKYGYKLRVD